MSDAKKPERAPEPRKFPGTEKLDRDGFRRRFQNQFRDPAFEPFRAAIDEMTEVAWQAEQEGRKAPITQPAGPGYADPSYELADDWVAAKRAIAEAQARHENAALPSRVLVISASNRNDTTCPGEVSKSRLLADEALRTLKAEGCATDLLDLSLISSQFGRTIHPCKACVSTAMPLCHWPCSCYPNYALGQTNDWMNEIYPLWVAAHGILIITPVNWYQAPSTLKLMIDRLVCADGGNPDQTTTHGKDAKRAKEIELAGWHYPRHLAGRVFSVVVHGDAAGVDSLQNALSSWLSDMQLTPAGQHAELGRYVGYYEPYATSHLALDRDEAFHAEVRQTAGGLAAAVRAMRTGALKALEGGGDEVRPK